MTPAAMVDYTDVPLAVLDLSGVTPVFTETSDTWAAIGATLTAEGEPAFSDFYTPGTALDPVTVVLGATTVAPGTGGTGTGTGAGAPAPAVAATTGTLPYTGGDSAPVLLAGIVLVGGGAALALVAWRRRALVG
jgi:LPXTG-motif cell wall-anchored protein